MRKPLTYGRDSVAVSARPSPKRSRASEPHVTEAFFAPTGQKFVGGEPRILYIDLETAPLLGYAFQMWEADILEVVRNTFILCYAYKWEHEREAHVVSLRQFKGYKKRPHDDGELCKALWKLVDEADIIISQNGISFDAKVMNARFLYHKLPPPRSYIMVDTYRIFKKFFKMDSNSQDRVGQFLGTARKKKHHGSRTWIGCINGEVSEWKIMEEYNLGDIAGLVENYKRVLEWLLWQPNRRRAIPVKA